MTTNSSLSTNPFLSSISFNLLSFSCPFPSILSCPFYLSLFPCLYHHLPSYHIFNLSTLLCLLFVPSLMCLLTSCYALVFGSPLPAVLPLLSCLTSPPYALFLSHTDSVFYLFTFLPPRHHCASLLADALGLFTYSLSLLPWRYTNPSLSLVTV